MKHIFALVLMLAFVIPFSVLGQSKKMKAIFLEDLSWTEAQKVLTPDAVVVLPLGAAAKEHGPHLPLATDFIQAEGYKNIIATQRRVVFAPTINYGYYPAFVKYPGSTTTYWSTSRELILQVVRTLSAFGPRRFYIINIGVSTTPVLASAAAQLREEGIVLFYSDYGRPNYDATDKGIRQSVYGGHADEMESSNVLFFSQRLVNMARAANDSSAKDKRGPMSPVPLAGGTYNPTGINGYAKLATKQKGKLYSEAFAKELIKDIDSVQVCALPKALDNAEKYKKYEGTYTDAKGRKLMIGQQNNHLFFVWNSLDQRNFYPLYADGNEQFSAVPMKITFVVNDDKKAIKALCNYREEVFWVLKE